MFHGFVTFWLIISLCETSAFTEVSRVSRYPIISQCPFFVSPTWRIFLIFFSLSNCFGCLRISSIIRSWVLVGGFLGTYNNFLGTSTHKNPHTSYTPATTLQLPMNQPIMGGRTPATFVILLPLGHSVRCPAHTRDSVVWRRSSTCRLPLTCGGGDRRWTSLAGTGTRSRGGWGWGC